MADWISLLAGFARAGARTVGDTKAVIFVAAMVQGLVLSRLPESFRCDPTPARAP